MANINPTTSITIANLGYSFVYLDWNLLVSLYGAAKIDSVTTEITKFFTLSFPGEGKWEGSIFCSKGNLKHAKRLFSSIREENNKRQIPIPLRGILYSSNAVPVAPMPMITFLKHYSLDPLLILDTDISDPNKEHKGYLILCADGQILANITRITFSISIPTLSPIHFVVTGKIRLNILITRDFSDISNFFHRDEFVIIYTCIASSTLDITKDSSLAYCMFTEQNNCLNNIFHRAHSMHIGKVFNKPTLECAQDIGVNIDLFKPDTRFGIHEMLYTLSKPEKNLDMELINELREIKIRMPPAKMSKIDYDIFTTL